VVVPSGSSASRKLATGEAGAAYPIPGHESWSHHLKPGRFDRVREKGLRRYPARRELDCRCSSSSRNRFTRSRSVPAGSLSPRSHLVNVAGSTTIRIAASFCESPSMVRWRINCSASVLAAGSGLCAATPASSYTLPASAQLRTVGMPRSSGPFAPVSSCARHSSGERRPQRGQVPFARHTTAGTRKRKSKPARPAVWQGVGAQSRHPTRTVQQAPGRRERLSQS
jgi:hypothetical protein